MQHVSLAGTHCSTPFIVLLHFKIRISNPPFFSSPEWPIDRGPAHYRMPWSVFSTWKGLCFYLSRTPCQGNIYMIYFWRNDLSLKRELSVNLSGGGTFPQVNKDTVKSFRLTLRPDNTTPLNCNSGGLLTTSSSNRSPGWLWIRDFKQMKANLLTVCPGWALTWTNEPVRTQAVASWGIVPQSHYSLT